MDLLVTKFTRNIAKESVFFFFFLTVIVMFCEIRLVDEKIVITIELPELAVDHIEMLIAEVSRYLIDIFLVLEDRDHREQIASSQLRHGNPSAPASIHAVKYPSDHLDRMKIRRLTTLNINFVALILPPRY